jgi:hypothetical protein
VALDSLRAGEGILHPGASRLNPAYKMKCKLIALSRRYAMALRKHLQQGPGTIQTCGTALALGHQAVTFGLETHRATNAALDPGVILFTRVYESCS